MTGERTCSRAPRRGDMFDFDQLNGLIGTSELLDLGRRYAPDDQR